jgi:pterin-4a-carbinolamine dehydratase
MKVSNVLKEYFQNSHSDSFSRIVESLPRNVPIEVAKSSWKRDKGDVLSRTFSFEDYQELTQFVTSLMKIVWQFSLSRKIEISIANEKVTVHVRSQQDIEVSEFLDETLRNLGIT